jgi:hypothetical protein
MATIVVAVAALTVLASEGVGGLGGEGSDQVVTPPDATVATSTTPSTRSGELLDGAAEVTGVVTAMHLELAVPEPRTIDGPFTIFADRGFGNGGTLTGVRVDGTPATIEWDAGTPFVISSHGALVLDPVRMDLTPNGIRLNLADAVHGFAPGTYHLDTTVAVGSSGVARPRETVVFDADDSTRFELRGDAAIFLDPSRVRRLRGPGVVHLEGTFDLRDRSGTRAVTRVDVSEAPFEITLTPVAEGGWRLDGRLGGQIAAA